MEKVKSKIKIRIIPEQTWKIIPLAKLVWIWFWVYKFVRFLLLQQYSVIFQLAVLWANILKYTDPTRFSGPPWRADKQDKARWHFQGKAKTAAASTSGNNCPFFFCKRRLQWAAFLAGYSDQWLMLIFQAPCSAAWSIPDLPSSLTSWKFPHSLTALGLWFLFPSRHDSFLKDRLKMLTFPFFVKVFGKLWATNWEKTAMPPPSLHPTENLCLKRYIFFLKKKGYLICLPGQPRNCYTFRIHSCLMFFIIR